MDMSGLWIDLPVLPLVVNADARLPGARTRAASAGDFIVAGPTAT